LLPFRITVFASVHIIIHTYTCTSIQHQFNVSRMTLLLFQEGKAERKVVGWTGCRCRYYLQLGTSEGTKWITIVTSALDVTFTILCTNDVDCSIFSFPSFHLFSICLHPFKLEQWEYVQLSWRKSLKENIK